MTAVKATPELSAPVEDYLKAIYEIAAADEASGGGAGEGGEADAAGTARTGGVAGTSEIAQALGFAPASVTGMLRRLADQGLLTYERYRGVRLTDGGRRAALRTIRRHRVIEAYLTSALGYPWDRVHAEAERLEHAASDELIDRMAKAIGEPSTDPHGAPIPTREGTLDTRRFMALSEVDVGTSVQVRQVGDRDPERLRYLAELGIVPGAVLRVVERAPFGGPIVLRVAANADAAAGGRGARRGRTLAIDRAIGPALAAEVFVAVMERRGRRGERVRPR